MIRGRAARRTIKLIESAMNWRVGNRAGVINQLHTCDAAFRDAMTSLVKEAQADMPLAGHGRGVTLIPEQLWQRQLILFDKTRTTHALKDTAIRNAEGHPTGQ